MHRGAVLSVRPYRACEGVVVLVSAIALCCASAWGGGSSPVFEEATAASGLIHTHRAGASAAHFAPMMMSGGGAVGDFDNDGDQDVFVLGGDGPDALFINAGDGTFTNQAAGWGVAHAHLGFGAAVGDYNGDGWLDLYVTSAGEVGTSGQVGAHKLYRNNGNGTFTDVALQAGVAVSSATIPDGFGAAFGDHDLDGDLDLFVCGWRSGSNGNRLFTNNGDGTFTDTTDAAGLDLEGMHGFSPRFVDTNGDRYPELLIAADFGTSRYLVNNADGTFYDSTIAGGLGLDGNGMGQCVGDCDNDGRLDWYVTSVYLEGDEEVEGDGVPGTGNMLYMCVGDDSYSESATVAGVSDGGWGWGTVCVDVNHDGLADLVETNGWVWGIGLEEHSYLFMNQGNGTFVERAQQEGFVHTQQGRGLVNFDADNDGDQDLIVFSFDDELRFYKNTSSGRSGANWLKVMLDTSARPGLAPEGFGARVEVRVGSQSVVRSIDGGCSFLSVSELSAHFGLGAVGSVDKVVVHWSDGRTTVATGVGVNQTLILEPGGCDGDSNGDGVVDVNDISYLLFRMVDGRGVGVDGIVYVLQRLGTCRDAVE